MFGASVTAVSAAFTYILQAIWTFFPNVTAEISDPVCVVYGPDQLAAKTSAVQLPVRIQKSTSPFVPKTSFHSSSSNCTVSASKISDSYRQDGPMVSRSPV